jgi:CubicO group peptidase (beta-lactamase class C family)
MRWLWAALLLTWNVAWAERDLDKLIADLQAERDAQSVAGVSFTLVSGQQVLWQGGLGVLDWTKPGPVTADTLFRIGSLTKVFTASALLQMQEEGVLTLSDRVRLHAPNASYSNEWESTHPITIAELLEHTAGFQDLTNIEFESSDPKPLTLEEGLAVQPESRTTRWKPGLH